MADFKLNAEIMVEAKQALKELKKVGDASKGTKKEFSFLGKVITLDAKRIARSFALMGLVAGKLFQSILQSSPSMRAAFIEMEIAVFEMSLAIGEALAPVINDTLVPAFNALRDIILGFSPDVQLFIGLMVALTIAVVAVAAAVFILKLVSLPLIGVVLLIVAALALLIIAWRNNVGGIQEIVGTIVNFLRPEIDNIMESFGELLDALKVFWDAIAPILGVLFLGVLVAITIALKFGILPAAKLVIDILTTGFRFIGGIIGSLLLLLKGDFNGAITGIKDAFIGIFDDILTSAGEFIASLLGVFGPIGETIGDLITGGIETAVSVISGIINILFGIIESVINAAIIALNFLISGANLVPGVDIPKIKDVDFSIDIDPFAEGGTVDRTGLIFAHRKEEILRPVEARQFREEKSNGKGNVQNFNVTIKVGSVDSKERINQIFNMFEQRMKRNNNRRFNI